jgi:hypothetical protein
VLAIRLYITVLILAFLLTTLLTRGIGRLEGTVVVCALLYVIFDINEELRDLRLLEARVSSTATLES